MNKIGIIYMATSPSGKSYIGQTIQGLKTRVRKHYADSKNHTYAFANALRKYNMDEWKWKIIHNNIEIDFIDLAEICAIYTYNTYYNGYNSTVGGDDNPMRYKKFRLDNLKGKKQEEFVNLVETKPPAMKIWSFISKNIPDYKEKYQKARLVKRCHTDTPKAKKTLCMEEKEKICQSAIE